MGAIHGKPLPSTTPRGKPMIPTAGSAEIPLARSSVFIESRDFAAEVTVAQFFVNTSRNPVECDYAFPLPMGATVFKYEVQTEDKLIKGQVMEKEEAHNQADDAIAQGHGTYMLEQETETKFKASVGNLPPNGWACVRLGFLMELGAHLDTIRLLVPKALAPPVGVRHSRIPADVLQRVGPLFEARFTTSFVMRNLRAPASPGVLIRPVEGGHGATVRLEGEHLKQDLCIEFEADRPAMGSAWLEPSPARGTAAALVSVFPQIVEEPDLDDLSPEINFIVDRSGSMSGGKIAAAKAALQVFLRSVPPHCRFNIIGFGSSTVTCFPAARPYDDRSLAEATAHVDLIKSDLGGTELIQPLDQVFGRKADPHFPRVIFLLTDGQVNNRDECIEFVRLHVADTRVFTFGLGTDCDHDLCEGLAKAGGGLCKFVDHASDGLEAIIITQLNQAMKPVFVPSGVHWSARVPRASVAAAPALAAADAHPRALALAMAQPDSPDRLDGGPESATLKGDIVRLSLAYGLVCPETAFLAIDEREFNPEAAPTGASQHVSIGVDGKTSTVQDHTAPYQPPAHPIFPPGYRHVRMAGIVAAPLIAPTAIPSPWGAGAAVPPGTALAAPGAAGAAPMKAAMAMPAVGGGMCGGTRASALLSSRRSRDAPLMSSLSAAPMSAASSMMPVARPAAMRESARKCKRSADSAVHMRFSDVRAEEECRDRDRDRERSRSRGASASASEDDEDIADELSAGAAPMALEAARGPAPPVAAAAAAATMVRGPARPACPIRRRSPRVGHWRASGGPLVSQDLLYRPVPFPAQNGPAQNGPAPSPSGPVPEGLPGIIRLRVEPPRSPVPTLSARHPGLALPPGLLPFPFPFPSPSPLSPDGPGLLGVDGRPCGGVAQQPGCPGGRGCGLARGGAPPEADRQRLVATLAVLAFLAKRCPESQPQWQLMARKGRQYCRKALQGAAIDPELAAPWAKALEALF
ncbi:putative Vault protein inter-alpha-trypsin domain [Paratrimastix pyriformis]|uniref:Vault protein inter-alpha-trypsin domain n=1 Tax=Paratrimastix pyriformis TaxID=342808 RepID=A0ABQ8ULP1_9EUKA|nr:putative Vault protein inter-alpha-trypsin domain [Paratrimastix pyriformis]